MPPSPIGHLSSDSQTIINCYSKKYPMNLGTKSSPIAKVSNINDGSFLSINNDNITKDSFLFKNLSTSPECSRSSSSSCSSFSSLTCSLSNKKKTKSIENSQKIDIINNKNSSIISEGDSMFSETINSEYLNDNGSTSFCFSLDKVSNSSFMEYFNLSDSISFSPPNNLILSENQAKTNIINSRKTNLSISSTNFLFPNFDDYDENNNFYDSDSNFLDHQEVIKQNSDYKKPDLGDLTINDNIESSSQIENNEALLAIREMAIRERRSQQRKHKNSTSSVSSTSMSSRIKKFAIDLQHTANNLIKDNSTKSTCLYSNNNNYNNNNNNQSETIEQHNLFDDDFDLDKIRVDDGELNNFLGIEGWEEMLDEDCISRLTTNFNVNLNKSTTNDEKIQNELDADKILMNGLSLTENEKNEKKIKINSFIPINNLGDKKNQIVNQSINSLKITTPLKLPSTTVLSSPTIIPKLQNLSNRTLINKSQPLVVVLSSPSWSNETTKTNQFKQVVIGSNCKTSLPISPNKSLELNQLKKENCLEKDGALINENENRTCKNSIEDDNKSSSINNKSVNLTNSLGLNNQDHDLVKEISANQSELFSANTQSLTDNLIEVIDCINPDQIFPYRLVDRKKNDELVINISNNNYQNKLKFENLEKNLSKEKKENVEDDEDDEEEIDVVSINNNSIINLIGNINANIGENNKKINNKTNKNNELNLNHHNYFHPPTSSNGLGNKKNISQTSFNLPKKVFQQKDESSLLAKFLKSTTTTSTTSTLASKNVPLLVIPSSKSSDSIQASVDSVVSKFSSNSNEIESDKKQITNGFNKQDSSKDFSKNKISPITNALQTSISKSISSSFIQKYPILNAQQNKKNSFNNLPTTVTAATKTTTTTQTLSNSQKFSNSIRILTTTSNNTNSVIRQINQTTTLNSKNQTSKVATVSNSSNQATQNFIKMPSNSTISKLPQTKNVNQSKVITTTLIAKPQINNLVTNHLTNKNSLIVCSINNKKLCKTINGQDSLNDFKQKLLFSKSDDKETQKISKLLKNVNKISHNTKSSVDDEYEFDEIEAFYDEDFDDDEDDDIEEEDDDVDDAEESDDSEDDVRSGLSQTNSTFSPLSLASSGHSSVSSGCSTPTKSKLNKINSVNKTNSYDNNKFNMCTLNEKLKTKSSRKNKSIANGQSMKRNNRLNTIGYSSENPAEKRAFHILSERQRRNDLKKLFETLRTNIPNLCDKQKASKLTILKAAVDHLIEVSNKKEKLSLIFDKEKQKNAILVQNLKNLQKSFNNNNNFQCQNSSIATLVVH